MATHDNPRYVNYTPTGEQLNIGGRAIERGEAGPTDYMQMAGQVLEAVVPSIVLELAMYLEHGSWRCDYRERYKTCCCGLDELTAKYGLPTVPPDDPEAVAQSGMETQ